MSKIIVKMLKIYKLYISPWLGTNCRHYPSCSEYAAEAIDRYGIVSGSIISIKRLIKCNQLFPGGYDPVPGPVSRGTICSN